MMIIKKIRAVLPTIFKKRVKAFIFNFTNTNVAKEYLHCPICESRLKKFIPLFDICEGKFMADIEIGSKLYSVYGYETLNVENFLCPICGATDKARLYALYFKTCPHKEKFSVPCSEMVRLIHFAPEVGLEDWLRKISTINYRSADLYKENVDDCVDLANMVAYPSNSIDIIICSHILEHVQDDSRAISELHRVLKSGGWAIIMVPLMEGIAETYEDPSITTEVGRLRHFGLEDHLRVYEKKSFLKKLKLVGFDVKEYGVEYFGVDVFKKHGISEKSVLYIVEKK